MDIINVLVNRYGGDMIEVDTGDKETLQKTLAKKMSDSLRDMAHDLSDGATSGTVHYDMKNGTGSIRYARERKFGPSVAYADDYEIVEVPAPDYKSRQLLIAGTEGMPVEAVMFCPDGISPMDYIRKKLKVQKIIASWHDKITVLGEDGRVHFWNSVLI